MDDVFILNPEQCGGPRLDPTRPPQIRLPTGGTRNIEVDLFLIEPPAGEVCLPTGPPPFLARVRLGRFPLGVYPMRARRFVRPRSGGDDTMISETFEGFEVRSTPNPALSGTWFDPATPGVGLVVNLVAKPGALEPSAFVFLNTLDGSGNPEWYWGLGSFVDARLQIPLTQGGSTFPSGHLLFEYLGCGMARLETPGLDVRFPIGAVSLRQLTDTVGVPPCEPPLYLPPTWH